MRISPSEQNLKRAPTACKFLRLWEARSTSWRRPVPVPQLCAHPPAAGCVFSVASVLHEPRHVAAATTVAIFFGFICHRLVLCPSSEHGRSWWWLCGCMEHEQALAAVKGADHFPCLHLLRPHSPDTWTSHPSTQGLLLTAA